MSWHTIPIGRVFRRVERRGREDLPLLSVYRDYGVVTRKGREDNFNRLSDDLSTYKVVEVGDLVLNKMKTWQGSLGVSPFNGIVSPAYFVGRPTADVNARYMHHLLRSQPLIAEYRAHSKGIRPSQWDLPWDEFAAISIQLPSIKEQRAIAHFLDIETARIDALITKKRRLIDLLTARSRRSLSRSLNCDVIEVSGMPAPSADDRIPLKRVANIQGGLTLGKNYVGHTEKVSYIRVANVQDGYLDLENVATIAVSKSDSKRFALKPGDVLVLEGNGNPENLGRGAIWKGQIAPCLHQNHVHAVRPHSDRLLPDFLDLVLKTEWARHFFTSGSAQVSIATLSQSRLGDLPLPVPSLVQQEQLIEKVSAHGETIEKLTSSLKRQIQLLQEHRQALITAAVTGEIEVPGAAA